MVPTWERLNDQSYVVVDENSGESEMGRRPTAFEVSWPVTHDFVRLAASWNKDASDRLLSIVWDAYDMFMREAGGNIEWGLVDEEIERQISQLLELCIHRVMNGFEPFQSQHGSYEYETRLEAPAQPPQYDIAFIWIANPRLMWPLEAKALRTDRSVSEYVKDFKNNFLTCRYAPFSSEGAMLGYLRKGKGSVVIREIGKRICCEIREHPAFTTRDHGVSDHIRSVPPNRSWAVNFRCHHLVMQLRPVPTDGAASRPSNRCDQPAHDREC